MAILLTNKVDLTGLKDGDSRLNTIKFLGEHPKIDLHLQELISDEGIVILRYSKR